MSGTKALDSRAVRPHQSRRRIVGLCIVVSVLAVGGGGIFSTTFSSATLHRAAARAHPPHRYEKKRHAKLAVRTFLGPDGVESSAILAENQLPGTTAWQISGQPATGMIEGFANTTYAAAGQSVTLFVSTTASAFRVTAYRMGYYQGLGARQIWQSGEVIGVVQPVCPQRPASTWSAATTGCPR